MDNNPMLGEDTVTVSPFGGECDICPNDGPFTSPFTANMSGTVVQLSMWNFTRMMAVVFPFNEEKLSMICHGGLQDTLKYLMVNSKSLTQIFCHILCCHPVFF